MKQMPKWLKDSLTTDDGQTFAPDKVAWALGVFTFLGLAIWAVVINKEHFDMQGFGIGFGATLAGAGAAGWLLSRQKPTGGQQ